MNRINEIQSLVADFWRDVQSGNLSQKIFPREDLTKLEPFFPSGFLDSMDLAIGFVPLSPRENTYLVIMPITEGKTIDHVQWKTMPLLSIVMIFEDSLDPEAVIFGYHTLHANPPIPRGFTYAKVPPGGMEIFEAGVKAHLEKSIVLLRGLSHLEDVLIEDLCSKIESP